MVKIKIMALLLCLAAVLACGCTSSLPAQAPGPVPTATITAQPTTKDLPKVTATETPEEYSIYMYSTARGLKYHEAGFVCTSKDQTYIVNSYGQEIGIWCER